MIVGGHIQDFVGENKLSIYNTKAGTWDQSLPQMNAGPLVPPPPAITLANGDVLMVSGDEVQSQGNPSRKCGITARAKLRSLDAPICRSRGTLHCTWRRRTRPFSWPGPKPQTRMLDLRGRGAWTDVAQDQTAGSTATTGTP